MDTTQNQVAAKNVNYTTITTSNDNNGTVNNNSITNPSSLNATNISTSNYNNTTPTMTSVVVNGPAAFNPSSFSPSLHSPTSSRVTNAAYALKLSTTPKRHMLQALRGKLLSSPGGNGGACELQALGLEHTFETVPPLKLIKERYVISAQPSHISAAAAAKTPASYRHLIDITSSNLTCLDVFTGHEYLCKIINEPLHKVQRAYFQLQHDDQELLCSTIYGHPLIRGVHDIVPLSKYRTYIIIAPVTPEEDSSGVAMGVYENLHTYIRNHKRICEEEARTIFHQICQTVQVCHRNGIILRDLKLKRFYFIDEARTKLQYESLEGSMLLDDPADDTLSDKIGCPLYTAPELLCPQSTYKGKPADMWSLGVILYTMLVGQYPFYEKANCNLITIIRHGNVQIPSSISRPVRWLLLALLRKNYEERLTASHIFLTPWLKEQRPFHMYIPVDFGVSTEDDNDDEEMMSREERGDDIVSNAESLCFEDYNVQPLDYTRSTLQMAQDQLADRSTSNDVDMG